MSDNDKPKEVQPVDLEPGDYLLTSHGDGTGRAIVTIERRLLVEQFGGGWSDLTDVYPCRSWRFEKVGDPAPTPIDPADIRQGDVVELRYRLTICQVSSGYVISEDGSHWAKDAEDAATTWHLVHRPDPDAEAVEALLAAGLTDDANLIESDTARIARRYLANLREQGWDVTRRQNGQEHA